MTNREDEPQISNVAPLGRLGLAPNSSETLAALAMRKSQSRCGSGRLWHSRNTDWPDTRKGPVAIAVPQPEGVERGRVCNIVAIWIFALCHWNGLFGNSTVFLASSICMQLSPAAAAAAAALDCAGAGAGAAVAAVAAAGEAKGAN